MRGLCEQIIAGSLATKHKRVFLTYEGIHFGLWGDIIYNNGM